VPTVNTKHASMTALAISLLIVVNLMFLNMIIQQYFIKLSIKRLAQNLSCESLI